MSDSAEERAQALVGKTLGERYRLDELIGQGAMGAVYRARAANGAVVALKTLSAGVTNPQSTQRFLRESELVRGLEHPHVVRTLDSGADHDTGLLFLVMPLLKGRDLDRVLEELGALEPENAVRIALQAARGLSAAHRIGIIHRDVKPGNLVLDEENGEIVVRVCDFGIAKQLGGQSELTATGSQLGTPDYVSPEQLKSSKHVDERTDVWSLGATLYQMLCGAAPFAHIDSVFDVITAIVSEDPPHLQKRAPWVDATLALIVHKALERDPNRRWPSLSDMADALRPYAGGDERLDSSRIVPVSAERRQRVAPPMSVPAAAKPTSSPPSPSAEREPLVSAPERPASRPAKPERPRRTAMLVVALLSAALAGGAAYLLVRAGVDATAPIATAVVARVHIVPPEAKVLAAEGEVPVVAGVATFHGNAGQTLQITVEHGGSAKTFSVSLGEDGSATPNRLVLVP